MINEDYKVILEDVFEGPMDLLVHLIRKNELDIYDIPIAFLTEQYLAYIEWMKSMNIDFASDFIVMASSLTKIKSKMLLPVHEGDEDEDEDPRMAIARPIEEYLQMQAAAEELAGRPLMGEDIFTRTPPKSKFLTNPEDEVIQVGLFELIDAFQKILEKIPAEHKVDLTTDRMSVKERINELVDILQNEESVVFTDLFKDDSSKRDIILTFLAVLEMTKLCLVKVAQHVQTGIIRLFYL